MPPSAPRYVHPDVIQRLYDGDFVALREETGSLKRPASQGERRNHLSPLSVVKRCIRYEPRVFDTWSADILRMASLLNDPAIRILTVSGPEGNGKTSLMRGVVELMGGGTEQLLWYDALPQSDPSRALASLLEGLTYLVSLLDPAFTPDPRLPPLECLPRLCEHLGNTPLLVVLDPVDSLLSQSGHWRSSLVREMVHQLLSFPFIKLALIGEQLPEEELKPWRSATANVTVPPLKEQDVSLLLRANHPQAIRSVNDTTLIQLLSRRLEGAPWLIRCAVLLGMFTTVNLDQFKAMLQEAPVGEIPTAEALTYFLWERLEPGEQSLLAWLALIRHPLNLSALRPILPQLDATLLGHFAKGHVPRGSLLRALIRQRVMPQSVVETLRQPAQAMSHVIQPWIWLYRPVRNVIAHQMSQESRQPRHALLAQFYQQELARPKDQRFTSAEDTFLTQELQWHQQQAGGTADSPLPDAPETYWPTSTLSPETNPESVPPAAHPANGLSVTTDLNTNRVLFWGEKPGFHSSPVFMEAASRVLLHPAGLPRIRPSIFRPLQEKSDTAVGLSPSTPTLSEPSPPALLPVTRQYRQARVAGDAAGQIDALMTLAVAWQQDPVRLAKYAERVEALLPQAPPHWKAAWYALQGSISLANCQLGTAQAWLMAAWQGLEPLPDWDERLVGLRLQVALHLAQVAQIREQTDQAISWLTKALSVLKDPAINTGTATGQQAQVLFQLASLLEDPQPRQALAYYEQALACDRQTGNQAAQAAGLANIGRLHARLSDWASARESLTQSLLLDEALDQVEGQLSTLDLLIRVAFQQPDINQALAAARRLLRLAQTVGSAEWMAQAYIHLAILAETQAQDFRGALGYYQAMQADALWPYLAESSQKLLRHGALACQARAQEFLTR